MPGTQSGKPRSNPKKAPPANVSKAPAAKAVTVAAPKAVKTAVPKGRKPTTPTSSVPAMDSVEWRQWVANAAYLRAEARGFIGGSPEQDWFEAEAALMAALPPAKTR